MKSVVKQQYKLCHGSLLWIIVIIWMLIESDAQLNSKWLEFNMIQRTTVINYEFSTLRAIINLVKIIQHNFNLENDILNTLRYNIT